MIGSHLIRAYSKTQPVIAKSSCESELYAAVRASTEVLGMITLFGDFGLHDAKVRIGMYASAAIGMAQRTVLNKVHHVEVDILWMQDQLARRILLIIKVDGPRTFSDLCTKNVSVASMEQYLEQLGTRYKEGRAAIAQKLHALSQHSLVNAHFSVGGLLVEKTGGQIIGRVSALPGVGDLLLGAIGGSGPCASAGGEEKMGDKLRSRSAEERCVDSWLESGEKGTWK